MLSIQPTLFGEAAVVRSWGRIGKSGGEKSELFETEQQAALRFLEIARCKRRKGYGPAAICRNGLVLAAVSPTSVDKVLRREKVQAHQKRMLSVETSRASSSVAHFGS